MHCCNAHATSELGLGRVKTLRRKGLNLGRVSMQGFFDPDYALIAAISG